MKKILFVIPQLGGGGGERVISNLANSFSSSLWHVEVIVFSESVNMSYAKNLRDGIIVSQLGLVRPVSRSPFDFLYKLLRAILTAKPDVLFLGSGTINAFLSPFLFFLPSGIRIIARETNLVSFYEKSVVIKFLYRFFYRNYDCIIAQSNDMKNEIIRACFGVSKKVVKIHNPVDTFAIEVAAELDEVCLNDRGLSLVTGGRLCFQKGFDLLLSVFAQHIITNSEDHLYIIGDGEDLSSLKTQVLNLGIGNNVSFLGEIDNPYAILSAADIFISSSRWEGFPNIVIEALVCGTPVLANNYRGGINEIINPLNGRIIDITCSAEFSDSIRTLMLLDSKVISSEAKEKYGERAIFPQYFKVVNG